jgi:hypothetical protein
VQLSSAEALKVFFGVLAVIVGIPAIVLFVKVGMFFGTLSRSVTALETAATAFSNRVDSLLDRLCTDVADHETRITVLEERGD